MIQLTKQNTARATEKAKATKPRVRLIEFGIYRVLSSDGARFYTVKLWKSDGRKWSDCDCKSAQKGVCYHVAAAIGLHTVLAAHRQTSH